MNIYPLIYKATRGTCLSWKTEGSTLHFSNSFFFQFSTLRGTTLFRYRSYIGTICPPENPSRIYQFKTSFQLHFKISKETRPHDFLSQVEFRTLLYGTEIRERYQVF